VHVSHLIHYLGRKFLGNIPNNCQHIANLLLGYFNLGHPVRVSGRPTWTIFISPETAVIEMY